MLVHKFMHATLIDWSLVHNVTGFSPGAPPGPFRPIPWFAVETPGLCRRCPGWNRGLTGRTGAHRSATGATLGMYRYKL